MCRKTSFFHRKMDFHAGEMNGKERMAFMLLGSQDVVYLVYQWMPPKLQTILCSLTITYDI
jgi:hypothetical protein